MPGSRGRHIIDFEAMLPYLEAVFSVFIGNEIPRIEKAYFFSQATLEKPN